MFRWLIAAVAACGVAAPALAQKSADETVKSLTAADGLQVELFAAEPLLVNPTSIDVDHLGRVWVCEAVNYRRVRSKQPLLRDAGDRIVVLTDKDGDGRADESTVFYQGKDLIAPLGIAVAKDAAGPGYKVFVCQSPDLLLFEDKDGDGKADGAPSKVLTNIGGFDSDHGLHGVNIGPDGKLYFTVGDAGVKGLQSSDGKGRKWESNTTDCRAGTVWKCDMDDKNLELIAHNFRNNYECCVNSFGEVWLSDNDDDGNQQTRICFVMPGGDYGYHPRGPGQSHWHEEQPGIVHKALRTGFGSPAGICFYEGSLLPKRYHGQLLHADAGPRELRAFHITPKGAGYELEKENLVTSTDTWFRLSDVCVAPDGSLMLADWYDPGVGGNGMGDWKMGRIYRVTPKGHRGYKVPATTTETPEGVRSALFSPCLATRYMATASLSGMVADIVAVWKTKDEKRVPKGKEAWKRLEGIGDAIRDEKGTTQQMARWCWAMCVDNSTGWNPTPLFRALDAMNVSAAGTDRSRPMLVTALRIDRGLGNEIFFDPGDVLWSELNGVRTNYALTKAKDGYLKEVIEGFAPTADAKRELLITMRTLKPEVVSRLFYALAKHYDGQDHFYRAALNIACGTDPKRREAILADFDKHFPDWTDKVADLAWELRPASVLKRLPRLLDDPKLTPAQKGRVVDILALDDDPAAGMSLLKLLGRDVPAESKSRALENLKLRLTTAWKSLAGSDELKATIDDLMKAEATRTTALQLIAAAGAVDRAEAVGDLATSKKTAPEVRREAVKALGKLRSIESVHALADVMTGRHDPLAEDAAGVLGTLVARPGDDPVSKAALNDLQRKLNKNDGEPAALLHAILSALAGSQPGTQWLLQQKEAGKLRDELVADTGRLLRNSPFQAERNKALILFPTPARLDPKKLPSPQVLAKSIGDPTRGEAVFRATLRSEAQCLRCHMVRGVGGHIGPDLSMIGKKASKENLFESLLNPSKAIADQYLQWKVDTTDGKSVTGLLVAESDREITLRDANGKDHTFAAKDLDGPKQKSLASIMPDNLVAALTEDELIDLVEYLLTLKTPSLSPERWHIAGPFPGGRNNAGLDTDHGPRKGPFDPKASFAGPDGKVIQWRTISPTATGYIDLAAFHGDAAADSVSYLYAEVESPVDQDGTVLLGSDEGVNLYVNGQARHTEKVSRTAAPGQARVAVKLKKGKNAILIQVANGDNPHGLYFALTSEQELKVAK